MNSKRYHLIMKSGECLEFGCLTMAFDVGKQTPGALLVFDTQAQTGEIESWLLRNGKWFASDICGVPPIPKKIMETLY